MARPKRSRPMRDISPTHPNAAAIDIGAKMHVAAVPPDRDADPVRTFGTFTGDLHRMADWFDGCGVRTVAMESTGVYWIPAFEVLDQRGFEVVLVNARDAKHVPGRKTDVSDAQWLRQLHEYGLLRASFRPKGELATLRAYLRQRERLLDYAASHIQHMQKALMQMNVQLHHIVSDITGATGMRIIRGIVAGERNPAALAAHRDRRCHASAEEVSAALAALLWPAIGVRSTYSPSVKRWTFTTSTKPRSPRATLESSRYWLGCGPHRKGRLADCLPCVTETIRLMLPPLMHGRFCILCLVSTSRRFTGSGPRWCSNWLANAAPICRLGRMPSISPPGSAWHQATRYPVGGSCRPVRDAREVGLRHCCDWPR